MAFFSGWSVPDESTHSSFISAQHRHFACIAISRPVHVFTREADPPANISPSCIVIGCQLSWYGCERESRSRASRSSQAFEPSSLLRVASASHALLVSLELGEVLISLSPRLYSLHPLCEGLRLCPPPLVGARHGCTPDRSAALIQGTGFRGERH